MDGEDPKGSRFIVRLNTGVKIVIVIVAFRIKYNNYDMGNIMQVP